MCTISREHHLKILAYVDFANNNKFVLHCVQAIFKDAMFRATFQTGDLIIKDSIALNRWAIGTDDRHGSRRCMAYQELRIENQHQRTPHLLNFEIERKGVSLSAGVGIDNRENGGLSGIGLKKIQFGFSTMKDPSSPVISPERNENTSSTRMLAVEKGSFHGTLQNRVVDTAKRTETNSKVWSEKLFCLPFAEIYRRSMERIGRAYSSAWVLVLLCSVFIVLFNPCEDLLLISEELKEKAQVKQLTLNNRFFFPYYFYPATSSRIKKWADHHKRTIATETIIVCKIKAESMRFVIFLNAVGIAITVSQIFTPLFGIFVSLLNTRIFEVFNGMGILYKIQISHFFQTFHILVSDLLLLTIHALLISGISRNLQQFSLTTLNRIHSKTPYNLYDDLEPFLSPRPSIIEEKNSNLPILS